MKSELQATLEKSRYSSFVDFVRDYPVSLEDHEQKGWDDSAVIDTSGGTLTFKSAIPVGKDTILLHDVGHLIGADDEDVLKPNIGLIPQRELGDDAERWEWAQEMERRAFAWMFVIMRHFTSRPDATERQIKKLSKAAPSLFGLDKDTDLNALSRKPGMTYENFLAEWERKIDMIVSAGRSNELTKAA